MLLLGQLRNYMTAEIPSIPEKEHELHRERVCITMLNTSFGDALKEPDAIEKILPRSEAQGLSVIGLSEVTPGVRTEAVAAIEEQGYRTVVPEGEGEGIDIVWAVSRGLKVRRSIARPFPGKLSSRRGERQKRDAGVLMIDAVTPEGRVLRLNTQRYTPPIRGGERARQPDLRAMAAFLDEFEPSTDLSVDIEVGGGDHQHANGPKEADRELWRGFMPIVGDGQATYDPSGAGRVVRSIAWALRRAGKAPTYEFDKIYARPGVGRELIKVDGEHEELSSNQIGIEMAEVLSVSGTDHLAIRTKVIFLSKEKPVKNSDAQFVEERGPWPSSPALEQDSATALPRIFNRTRGSRDVDSPETIGKALAESYKMSPEGIKGISIVVDSKNRFSYRGSQTPKWLDRLVRGKRPENQGKGSVIRVATKIRGRERSDEEVNHIKP